jgi:hypothetical protein
MRDARELYQIAGESLRPGRKSACELGVITTEGTEGHGGKKGKIETEARKYEKKRTGSRVVFYNSLSITLAGLIFSAVSTLSRFRVNLKYTPCTSNQSGK